MITFIPSRLVEKETSIDFEILSIVISKIFELNLKRRINYTIKVHKSTVKGTSYVFLRESAASCRSFTIKLDYNVDSLYENIKTILHEFRHIMQHTFFKCDVEVDFDNYTQYYNSPTERDARRCEKIAPAVLKAYRGILKSKEIFGKYELGTHL